MKSLLLFVSIVAIILFAAGAQGVFIESPYIRLFQAGLGTTLIIGITLFLMIIDMDSTRNHH